MTEIKCNDVRHLQSNIEGVPEYPRYRNLQECDWGKVRDPITKKGYKSYFDGRHIFTTEGENPAVNVALLMWLYAEKYFTPQLCEAIRAEGRDRFCDAIDSILKGRKKPKPMRLYSGQTAMF